MIKKFLILWTIFLLIFVGLNPIINGYDLKLFFEYSNSFSDTDIPNIMLTGYWNPTGQMIAPFSTDSYLNPDGWKGANWENTGYDIYSFFPTPDTYNGTFEVDYQSTWEDFWNITSEIRPIAIISFGVGDGPWEIEFNARNLDRWIDDEKYPYQPTPCPPDDTVPAGYVRYSTLPVQEIKDAVNNQTFVDAWIDWEGDTGAYLCEYIAYLGMWYQSIYKNDSKYPCKGAGFIHVKDSIEVEIAMSATIVTIHETIKYLNCVKNPPETPILKGPTIGNPGEEYKYLLNTTDPDNDTVYYYINWGDKPLEEWIGPYKSEENATVFHTWNRVGIYEIKVIAKDTCGAISQWATLKVKIPRNLSFSNMFALQIFQRFLNFIEKIKQLMIIDRY